MDPGEVPRRKDRFNLSEVLKRHYLYGFGNNTKVIALSFYIKDFVNSNFL